MAGGLRAKVAQSSFEEDWSSVAVLTVLLIPLIFYRRCPDCLYCLIPYSKDPLKSEQHGV